LSAYTSASERKFRSFPDGPAQVKKILATARRGVGENRFGRFVGPELAAEHAAADRAALLAQLKDEVDAETERRAKHEARWAEILDLPQLFIAI
jgi:hypothetical protein